MLEVRGLAFAYPDGHQALFGVDLHVHRGERVALLGPNGAGKTTLVLHLNGILTAGRGTVTVSGLPVAKEHLLEIRRRETLAALATRQGWRFTTHRTDRGAELALLALVGMLAPRMVT